MANGLGVNRDKLFDTRRLLPYIPHHKLFIESRLAGMKISSPDSYVEFARFYASFGVQLQGVELEVTFENASEEVKEARKAKLQEEAANETTDAPTGDESSPRDLRKKELEKLTVLKIGPILTNLGLPLEGNKPAKIDAILAKEFPAPETTDAPTGDQSSPA